MSEMEIATISGGGEQPRSLSDDLKDDPEFQAAMGQLSAITERLKQTQKEIESGEWFKRPDVYIKTRAGNVPVPPPVEKPLYEVGFVGADGKQLGRVDLRKRRSAQALLDVGGGRIDRAEVRKRAGDAMRRNLPTHRECVNTSDTWAIIGGGPSINDCVDEIRRLKRRGANIVSVNKTHDWLLERAIVPWGHILLDPKEWVSEYVKRPRKDVRYFIASQCHANTFEALKDYPVFLWHAGQDFEDGAEPNLYLREFWPKRPWYVVPGPTTVGTRAMFLGASMGPTRPHKFHFFGLDSSRSAGRMHAYDKPEPPDAEPGNVLAKYKGRGYVFPTNSHMARQWADFDKLVAQLKEYVRTDRLPANIDITFHGHGLLPFYAATIGWHANQEFNEDPSKVKGYIDVVSIPERQILFGLPRSA